MWALFPLKQNILFQKRKMVEHLPIIIAPEQWKMVKLLREPGLCIQNLKMLYIVFLVNYFQILTLICLDQVVVIGNT